MKFEKLNLYAVTIFMLLIFSCQTKEEKKNSDVKFEKRQLNESLEMEDTLSKVESPNLTGNSRFSDTLQYIGESEYGDYFVSLFLTRNFEVLSIVLNKNLVLNDNDRNKMLIAKWEKHLVTAAGDSEYKFEMAFMEEFKPIVTEPFKLVSLEGISNINQFNITILNFLSKIKTNSIEALAKATNYPLKREYPLPSIKNSKQFRESFHELFTDSLKNEIVNSDLQTEWSHMGYQGFMLKRGVIWLDIEGNLIAINRLSYSEKKKRKAIIEKEKRSLHTSVNKFDRPELLCETETFRIRIDKTGDKYRYVAWKKDKKQSEKPDLILNNGIIVLEGNGGNHHFEFNNGNYKYECHIIKLGEKGHPPGRLIVYQSGDEILKEKVLKIFNE